MHGCARQVLGFNALVAPIKCLLAPLSSKTEFDPALKRLGMRSPPPAPPPPPPPPLQRPRGLARLVRATALTVPCVCLCALPAHRRRLPPAGPRIQGGRFLQRDRPPLRTVRGNASPGPARALALGPNLGICWSATQGGRAGHPVRHHGRLPDAQGRHGDAARARHHQAADPCFGACQSAGRARHFQRG